MQTNEITLLYKRLILAQYKLYKMKGRDRIAMGTTTTVNVKLNTPKALGCVVMFF